MSKAANQPLETLPPQEAAELKSLGVIVSLEERPSHGKMRIDLHCHSLASPDCRTPVQMIPGQCHAQGIQVQAITDHNVLWGAQKLQALVEERSLEGIYNLVVIVGEEISTSQGELIGLFLKEMIQAGLSPEETAGRIKDQGGLVLLPHGFDPLKRHRLQPAARQRIAPLIDIVETFNTRVSRTRWNREAVAWAQVNACLMSAGSDAHTLGDIGCAWVEVDSRAISGPEDLLAALKGGIPQGKWTHPVVAYLNKLWQRTRSSPPLSPSPFAKEHKRRGG